MKEIDINKVIEILNGSIENAEITNDKLDVNLSECGMESKMIINC